MLKTLLFSNKMIFLRPEVEQVYHKLTVLLAPPKAAAPWSSGLSGVIFQ
jgi:hypothetical protein